MLNECMLVGRIKDIKEDHILLAIPRSTKNEKGEYDNDIVRIDLKGTIADNAITYGHKREIIGIRGKVCSGNKIVADKITFLTSGM